MTELEKMLPELNPAQHKWLQGYIYRQELKARLDEQNRTGSELNGDIFVHTYNPVNMNANIVSQSQASRIATLKRKAEGK